MDGRALGPLSFRYLTDDHTLTTLAVRPRQQIPAGEFCEPVPALHSNAPHDLCDWMLTLLKPFSWSCASWLEVPTRV